MINDLFIPNPKWRQFPLKPEMDPLTEPDALREAQLLDAQFDVLRSTAGLLFEMRCAEQLRDCDAAVLILRGVRKFSWDGYTDGKPPQAWWIVSSIVTSSDGIFGLELDMSFNPGAHLTLQSEHAEFYAMRVPGLGEIPDYGEDDDSTIRAQLPSWRSEFEPTGITFFEPRPPAPSPPT
jgi:hypothetical protein